jgi:hypothetical protein
MSDSGNISNFDVGNISNFGCPNSNLRARIHFEFLISNVENILDFGFRMSKFEFKAQITFLILLSELTYKFEIEI